APEGTIANMVLPGACAARGLTGFRMVDCMFGALAKMLPEQVFAASDGGNTGVSIGGYLPDRTPFIYVDFTCCAWGARPYADGLEADADDEARRSVLRRGRGRRRLGRPAGTRPGIGTARRPQRVHQRAGGARGLRRRPRGQAANDRCRRDKSTARTAPDAAKMA